MRFDLGSAHMSVYYHDYRSQDIVLTADLHDDCIDLLLFGQLSPVDRIINSGRSISVPHILKH